MNDSERRKALANFLRTRRERLSPQAVGLPPGIRRRTRGLRREEVAQLANIGTSWYTLMEQGRDVHPSEQVLESLAQALRLTSAERQHLFLLALQYVPAQPTGLEEQINPIMQQAILSLDPHPAYVMGRRWDLLTWNKAADYLFKLSATPPPYSRNMLWWFFNRKELRQHDDWEEVARSIIAQFRADSGRYPGDPWFAELIADLQRISEEFRQWWPQHDVSDTLDGYKEIRHSLLGNLNFEHLRLQVPGNPDLKVMIYTASPQTVARLASALHLSGESSLAQR
ncbi:XRE family transcriptional regulator [Ktedonosporobacter rubrisoli]|uniref:XRE family transcriptional regulator n=1 Tax=Ktedonosporobacter rubrisoli TaxID=2509675 RepID=A0A4P6JUM0_KTERU|nr:helix-turn-helix transcriptional regulator [Ktedonosporobacter rubrisoli]QBD79184.1 XRE family transcriptional regulator [Ktedonosporobacter rubrisoli]